MPTLEYLPSLKGDYFPIRSIETDRTYHIYVRLPERYDAGDKANRYPVVYLLDGDSLFPMLAAEHSFLSMDDKLPDVIVVGIAYGGYDPAINKRDIDFAPPSADVAVHAGAKQFQRFLKSELLPLIESRYSSDPQRRIIFGQSFGGTFVLYSAYTDPDLFWGRIASNPSLRRWRDLFFSAPAHGTRKDLNVIVVSGTADHEKGRADALEWFASWKDRTDAPWTVHPISIENGTHAANSVDAYRAGVRVLFNWRSEN